MQLGCSILHSLTTKRAFVWVSCTSKWLGDLSGVGDTATFACRMQDGMKIDWDAARMHDSMKRNMKELESKPRCEHVAKRLEIETRMPPGCRKFQSPD